MYNNFIPSWHFVNPEEKLKSDWCWQAVNWCWYHSNNKNLLHGKNIDEIEGYASGNFSMREFRRMYKSESRKMVEEDQGRRIDTRLDDTYGRIGFVPLPLIPTKLNSAIAIVQKVPVEITITAQDALAILKKNEDVNFLKNKPALEGQLQEIADKMGTGKVNIGTTKHSAIEFSDSPYGLDLNEPDELDVFVNILYTLASEAAFETALQAFDEIKRGSQVKLMEIKDQLKYGVSCNRPFQSAITHLPDVENIFPGTIETPHSSLPDYSDNTHRFQSERITVMELFNKFGDEIPNEAVLSDIINAIGTGYCDCNKLKYQRDSDFKQFKVDLIYCEIKSVDYVNIGTLNKKSKFKTLSESADGTSKVWGQNTYGFWWLKNTKHFFGINRLPYAYRTVGQESIQNFSTNIYKSQEKSAVEMSIGENKKAQIADIKMQHSIIMSLPPGKYINLKFLRSALNGLKKDAENKYTQQMLIDLAMEKNWFIGDTEGFDGKNDGQLKPWEDIPGGVKQEVVGYMNIIADASAKISQFTGINDQLTGQSANPEGLIGLQKLLINSSINALYYISEAIESQERAKLQSWCTIIKECINEGGKAKEAIINLVGSKKVKLIDAVKDIPIHSMSLKVKVSQREEERQDFKNEVFRLKNLGVLNTIDDYMLSAVTNPKDKMGLLAVKYKQWEKKQSMLRQEQAQNQQAVIAAQGQNQQAVVSAKTDGEIKKVYAQGDVSSKILELASQLGIQASQLKGVIDKTLQQSRGEDQLNKSVRTLETKQSLENQKPYE